MTAVATHALGAQQRRRSNSISEPGGMPFHVPRLGHNNADMEAEKSLIIAAATAAALTAAAVVAARPPSRPPAAATVTSFSLMRLLLFVSL